MNKKLFAVLSMVFCLVMALAGCSQTEIITHDVTFVSNGGTVYEVLSLREGTAVNFPAPKKPVNIFDGWYLTEDFSGEPCEDMYLVNGDVTFYAKWLPKTGTVTFVSNGGTAYAPLTFEGTAVALPSPEKKTFAFAGWYLNKECTGEALPEVYAFEEDATVYAKWVIGDRTYVNLETFGGTEYDPIVYTEAIEELPEPFRYGYEFDGWYMDEAYDEAVQLPLEVEEDTTVYAKWNRVTYVYMYYGSVADYKRFTFAEGDEITVDALNALFTPEDMVVEDKWGKKHDVPFEYWAYEGETEATAIKVTEPIVIGTEHVILVAQYDDSSVPAAAHIDYYAESDSYKTTGKIAHVFFDEGTPYGTFSVDIISTKGNGGGVGPAFRMNMPNLNYQYESGCEYLSAVIVPASGRLQVSKVKSGWAHMTGSVVPFASHPKSWQDYFNSLASGDAFSLTIKVVVTPTDFMVYFNNYANETVDQLVYQYSAKYPDTAFLDGYMGSGFGVRSSSTGTLLSNLTYEPLYTVEYEGSYDDSFVEYVSPSDAVTAVKGSDSAVLYENAEDINSAYFNRFIGWSYTKDGAPVQSFEAVKTYAQNGKVTMYAVYEKVELNTVTYDAKNGSALTYQYYRMNETVALPEAPEKNGYEQEDGSLIAYFFNAWCLGDAVYDVTAPVVSDLYLTASYNETTAFRVKYVIDHATCEDDIVPVNQSFTLPVPEDIEGYRFGGWFVDEARSEAYDEEAPVTANLTLYGAWIKQIAITFTALGETVESVVIDENGTLSALPSAPAKASETKQNGNILTFTFDAWCTEEGEKVTLNTVFAEDTVLVANYSHVEKRNGMVVTYDENGNAQYSIATTNRGTILDGMTCDWEAYSAYEFTHTLTYGKWNASKHANYRATIFTNAGSDIDFNGDKVDAGGMPEGTIWFNFQKGTVIFGAKIFGSSKNTWEATFGGLSADCPYKVHYNALVAGKPASFVWKFKYGVRDDNTAWIKLYVMDSLLFTYNLEADGVTHTTSDGKTLDMVDGEIVWGKVCNDNNQRTATPYYSPYINATESAVMTRGNDVGLWPWGSCANVGGLLIHDISNVPTESRDPMAKVHNVVYKNTYGTDIESNACLNDMIGSFVADDSDILFADAADKNSAYYNKFIGWSLTEGGEIATAFANATVVNGLITVYPVYQKIELNTLSFDADNGSETVYSYYAPGEAVVMPEAPEKEGYIAENGSQVTFVFKGWYAGDVAFDADAELTEDVALKAVYEKTSAFRVDFVTEYVTVEYALVAENGTFEPEMPADREDVYFAGWYYDAAYVNAFDASAPVTENLTLYGLWESYLEIKFVAQDETVDILSVKKNGSISEFPVAPEKDMDIKPNANQVTYAFDAWYTEAEEKVTAKTQFAESTTLTAKYSATETRNGMVVSYDENGKAQYSIATTNRGTILDGMTCDWETYSAYEFTHTLTYGKWNASKHTNYRATIFTNAGNDIDFNGDKDTTLVDAEGTIWFNFQRGTVIFGAKIYGSSKNTWETSFGGLSSDCPYKVHYNALVAGEPASFVWKYKYGVRNDNTAWIKLYVMDSLLFTYNLEADAAKHTTSDGKTLDMVDGEIVWGQVCNDNNQRTATPYYSPYINATEEAVIPRGNDVGLWPWGTCANVGGLLIHDISNTPIERRQAEDSSDGAQTVAVLEAVLPGDKRSVVTE